MLFILSILFDKDHAKIYIYILYMYVDIYMHICTCFYIFCVYAHIRIRLENTKTAPYCHFINSRAKKLTKIH